MSIHDNSNPTEPTQPPVTAPQTADVTGSSQSPADLLNTPPASNNYQPAQVPGGKKKLNLTYALGGVVVAAALFGGGVLVGTNIGDDSSGRMSASGPSGMSRPEGGSGQGGSSQGSGDGSSNGNSGGPSSGGFGGGFASGTITKIDGSTITIETQDGETTEVTVSDSTSVTLTNEGSVSDLAQGDSITVMGESTDDGVTASSISEGSSMLGGMMGGRGGFPGGDSGDRPGADDQESSSDQESSNG